MPPEFFYFDMGNVLLSFDYDVAARNMAAVCGAPAALCREVGIDSDLLTQFETGKLTPAQFHEEFSRRTNTTSDRDALLHARSDMFQVMAPTIRVLVQLKGVRQRTGLLSNTSADHFELCRRRFAAIRDLFDVYVLSYEVGVMKPDDAIYTQAIAQAGAPAERIFYCDDREENVVAAQRHNIDAVLFTSADQLIRDLRERGVEMNI
ncbi:MAG: HAD family phosphatase [Planctomycetales bacterium]|nr:HAD family phosphatase [Planctomycetales bacterium]